MHIKHLIILALSGLALAGCAAPEQAIRPSPAANDGSYASHFDKPSYRYDQNGHRVDSANFLIDANGRRTGGTGYWVTGPGDEIVPPGTHIDGTPPRSTPPRS